MNRQYPISVDGQHVGSVSKCRLGWAICGGYSGGYYPSREAAEAELRARVEADRSRVCATAEEEGYP